MLEDNGLFKNFDSKPEPKKDEKKKNDKDEIEIRIKISKKWFNRLFLERAIFIVIILILLMLVFYNPFGKYRCEKGLSDIKSEPVAADTDKSSGDEPVVETEPEPAAEKKDEPVVETEPEDTGPILSGQVTIDLQEVLLDANKTKVESVTVKIDNQKKILTPMVYLYWYDDSTEEAVKSKPNGGRFNYTGAIPLGTVKLWKLDDELANRFLRKNDEYKETFRAELYDASDNSLMDTVTKTITT